MDPLRARSSRAVMLKCCFHLQSIPSRIRGVGGQTLYSFYWLLCYSPFSLRGGTSLKGLVLPQTLRGAPTIDAIGGGRRSRLSSGDVGTLSHCVSGAFRAKC